jgi:hypothetical protein
MPCKPSFLEHRLHDTAKQSRERKVSLINETLRVQVTSRHDGWVNLGVPERRIGCLADADPLGFLADVHL